MLMRRWSMHLLLLSCAGTLLGIEGCAKQATTVIVPDGGSSMNVDDRAEAPAGPEAPFRLPADAAGKLLGKVLPPTPRPGKLDNPTRRTPPPVPQPRFADPTLALPAVTPDLPRLPGVVKKAPVRPEFVQAEALEESFLEPQVPRQPAFATGKRTHVPSEDAALPPPLQVLATPVPDRVSLEDATMDASTGAAVAAVLPERTAPAPYQRMTVPEPFENRRALTLSIPEERTEPASEGPRPPK
jgi:hypothetical protein